MTKLTHHRNFSVEELVIIFPCLAYVQHDFRETALVAAVGQGHLHVTEILVENGADVNYRNKVRALIPGTQVCMMQIGTTPMYFAAKNNHPRLVELLLAHGADINKVQH